MITLVGQVAPALVAMILGWVVLWPLRGRTGAAAYHLWALPIGLVVFAVAGAVSTVLARPLDAVTLAVALAAMAAAVLAVFRLSDDRASADTEDAVRGSSYLVAAAVLVGSGAALTALRVTVATNDGLLEYWPLAIDLARQGGFTAGLMAGRSALIPSFGAVHVAFGADWAYAIYPLLALNLLLLLVTLLRAACPPGVSRPVCVAVVGGAVAFLVVEPSFLFHSVFVHAHMISALYMVLAAAALWGVLGTGVKGSRDSAWLILGGLSSAGLALARPDGIAYVFVLVAAAKDVITSGGRSNLLTTAFFGSLLFPVYFVYAAAYLRLGLWPATSKLQGSVALGILCLLGIAALAPRIVQLLDERSQIRLRGDRFLIATTALVATALLVVVVLKPEAALLTLGNTALNLFWGGGGYGPLWYFVVGLIALTFVTGDALRPCSLTRRLLSVFALFYLVAGLVHVMTHPGRVGDLDSFTRVAFQQLPLAVWYFGLVLMRIAGDRATQAQGAD